MERGLMMKRLLAAALCLTMVLCMTAAVCAEGVESLFDGTWVQFEDGFEIYLPSDWYEFECTEEMNAQGIFYMAGTEDMSYSCTMAWQALEEDCTVEAFHAELVTAYPGAELVEVNGIAVIVYADLENDLLNCIALDASEPGFYMFAFSPADDEDFQNLAAAITASIRNL